MDLKIKQSILRQGNRFNEGDTINLPDSIAEIWIQKGFASKVLPKKDKTKFDTKELKVEYIEIKENETDQN